MELKKIGENEIQIDGSVNTIQSYQEIKSAVEEIVAMGGSEIIIVLKNTPTLTSSIIGYLIKTVAINKAKVTLKVSSRELYELLYQLNLTETFSVMKI